MSMNKTELYALGLRADLEKMKATGATPEQIEEFETEAKNMGLYVMPLAVVKKKFGYKSEVA